MDRLKKLENLVKELNSQLEQANASRGGSAEAQSPPEQRADGASPSFDLDDLRWRYVASGFWSRISDELDELKMDTRELAGHGDDESSEDEDFPASTPSTHELDRAPSERHAFMFRHNLTSSTPDMRHLRPLPSQIPFLLDTFSENVNFIVHVVHMPSIRDMVRKARGAPASLAPADEALMFAIYYAAVTSMEDDDVVTNFGSTKAELNLKFRRGLEQALAMADFLSDPNMTLVQALLIFLCLARRHDSPRYVWMMTGLLIRMAQAIGLHRDGSRFEHLSPFEVEQRRRVWWTLCVMDVRASEDQGTDFTITRNSFDTKMPLNVNVTDVEPDTKETPPERQTFTDMSFALAMFEIADVSTQMVASSVASSGPSLEEQTRLLNGLRDKLDQGFFQYSAAPDEALYQVGVLCTRLVLSKLTLLIYLPTLFASPNERFSEEVKDKLLVAAIEVAEHNHALNSEEKCRQWRWIYQTYTHWYAIVYLLIETCRRQWSPIVERAWLALHSTWLIPPQHHMSKNLRVWVPLRSLMVKARKHREEELARIRDNPAIIQLLKQNDRGIPVPASSGPFATEKDGGKELFLEYWRKLVTSPADPNSRHRAPPTNDIDALQSQSRSQGADARHEDLTSGAQDTWPSTTLEPTSQNGMPQKGLVATAFDMNPALGTDFQAGLDVSTIVPQEWTGGHPIEMGFSPWLWTGTDNTPDQFVELDMNMDVDEDMNWNTWLQSATGMELNMP
ncbi:hypothetical protein NM208_g9696 [Fusarium decemcellulare]|uniref:Uncharacterized protein n=1 Tax=Fusarium decemcellulare TaxID=57161 RepID=A0ACC1S0L1_9HYPO|nr:hypothetical protein NM208_g9696 [Fusarium decemcellulare]